MKTWTAQAATSVANSIFYLGFESIYLSGQAGQKYFWPSTSARDDRQSAIGDCWWSSHIHSLFQA